MAEVSILLIFAIGLFAGMFGAMVGLGGGAILVPLLAGLAGVPMHFAIGASLVSVIASSSVATVTYARQGLPNVRLGLTLEVVAAMGAVGGSLWATRMDEELLKLIFAGALVVIVLIMIFRHRLTPKGEVNGDETTAFDTEFYDRGLEERVRYHVANVPGGVGLAGVVGGMSGMLGIGGGVIKVPLMAVFMGIPMKAAAATSTYMIGLTGATGAFVFFAHGYVHALIATPVVLGIFLGSFIGASIGGSVQPERLVGVFNALALILAVELVMRVLSWWPL